MAFSRLFISKIVESNVLSVVEGQNKIMKNYFKDGFDSIVRALYQDRTNLVFFIVYSVLFLASYLVWKFFLESDSIFVLAMEDIYPIKYLAIVLLINTVLGVFAYEKEKEITYLLFGTNLFIIILILALEVFYLTSLSNA